MDQQKEQEQLQKLAIGRAVANLMWLLQGYQQSPTRDAVLIQLGDIKRSLATDPQSM